VRVAIVGGGQLGRMLVQAGERLGVACVTLDPAADSPASQVGPAIIGAYDDPVALARLVDGADVVTYEFENVPVDAMRATVPSQCSMLTTLFVICVRRQARSRCHLISTLWSPSPKT